MVRQLFRVPTHKGWENRNYLGDTKWFSPDGINSKAHVGTTVQLVPDGVSAGILRIYLNRVITQRAVGSILPVPQLPFVLAQQFYCVLTFHAALLDDVVLGQSGEWF